LHAADNGSSSCGALAIVRLAYVICIVVAGTIGGAELVRAELHDQCR
jgi:hypothetical protein